MEEENTIQKFKCDHCDEEFNDKSSLQQHQLSCPKQQPANNSDVINEPTYKCDPCNKTFSRKDHLTRHKKLSCPFRKKESSKNPAFQCVRCNRSFTRKDALTGHHKNSACARAADKSENMISEQKVLKSPHQNLTVKPNSTAKESDSSKPTINCESCNQSFARKDGLTRHLKTGACPRADSKYADKKSDKKEDLECPDGRTRESEPNPELKCEPCDKLFSSIACLKRHKKWSCPQQQQNLTNKTTLTANQSDGNKPHIKCKLCNQTFARKDGLAKHIKNGRCPKYDGKFEDLKSDDKNADLKSPGQNFLLKSTSTGKESDSSQPTIKCIWCNETFAQKGALTRHLKTGACPQADIEEMKSDKREVLKSPDGSKTESDSTSEFKCELCGKLFSSMASLKRHQKAYCALQEQQNVGDGVGTRKEPGFKCDWCSLSFTKDRLIGHQKYSSCSRFLEILEHDNEDILEHPKSPNSNPDVTPDTGDAKLFDELNDDNIKPKKIYKCNLCNKSFSTNAVLKRHHQSCPLRKPTKDCDRNNKRTFKCNWCDGSFTSKTFLTRHKIEGLCPKLPNRLKENKIYNKIQRREEVRKRKNNEHKSKEKYNCDLCNRKFASKPSLRRHKPICPVVKPRRERLFKPKRKHPCKFCGRTFSRPFLVRRHQATSCPQRQEMREPAFKCERCKSSFIRKEGLTIHKKRGACKLALARMQENMKYKIKRHVNSVSDGNQPFQDDGSEEKAKVASKQKYLYKCDPCRKRFTKRYRLILHFQRPECPLHQPSSEVAKYFCTKCKKTFNRKESLQYHMTWNACPGNQKCGQFKSESQYGKSITPRRFHKCKACSNLYTWNSTLRRHHRRGCEPDKVLNADGEGGKFACDVCDKVFILENYLVAHIKANKCKSKNNDPGNHDLCRYMCELCGATFHEKKTLNFHIRKKFCVSVLDKLQRELRWISMTTAEERLKLKCVTCNKPFSKKYLLFGHKKNSCLNIRSIIQYPHQPRHLCESCGNAYNSEQNYLRHMDSGTCSRSAQNEITPKFTCSHCSIKFTTKQSLRLHQNHRCPKTKLKKIPLPYLCTLCNLTFAKIGILEYHVYYQICKQNNTIAGKGKKFQCKTCHQRFILKQSMRNHCCRRICQGFQAGTIITETTTQQDLHKQLVHKIENSTGSSAEDPLKIQFPCRWCYARFTSQAEMITHMKTGHKHIIPIEKLEPEDDMTIKVDMTCPKTICCYICLTKFYCVFTSFLCLKNCERKINLSMEGYVHPRLR